MTHETYWQASGVAAPDFAPFAGKAEVETLVIGAGFTGINAALELVENGREAMVIDAQPFAGGASGRNGGFVSARFKMPPARIERRYGPEMTAIMARLSAASVEQVKTNVARYGLEETALNTWGNISAALNARHLKQMLAALPAGYVENGIGRILDEAEIAALTGSTRFAGGLCAPGALGIHPFNYLCGLGRAASAAGVGLHCNTAAQRLRRDGGKWVIETEAGEIRADRVIMAANAYSYLTAATRPLARAVVPFRSAVIVTERLSERQLATIMPEAKMMVDSRRLLRWFRLIDGRMLLGGRGAGHPSQDERAYERLLRYLVEVYPQLSSVKIEWRWSGYVGLTRDRLLHIGEVSDGIFVSGGYNGNGVATSSFSGRQVAKLAMGETPELGLLSTRYMKTMPLHRYSAPAVRVATAWFETLDRMGV